jgi:hypothetical protein
MTIFEHICSVHIPKIREWNCAYSLCPWNKTVHICQWRKISKFETKIKNILDVWSGGDGFFWPDLFEPKNLVSISFKVLSTKF